MSSKRTKVYFTVDTETSMGGAWRNEGPPLALDLPVYGRNGSHDYGVPLIMAILEEYGFRATFFTEVFCSYFVGREPLKELVQYIESRGHDVQLHLHPVYRFYHDFLEGKPRREQDLFFQFTKEEQFALIREGVALFREISGRTPRAFRAGCYGASEVTLAALRENGVEIDSSYNLAFLDQTCGFQQRPLNSPQVLEGILEYPVTNFLSRGGYKGLEISAVSVWEILATIRELRDSGCCDVVLVFHSFSFLKRRGVRFEKARPDRIVINRFRKLCSELSRMSDEIEVSVMGEIESFHHRPAQDQVIPSLGWFHPAMRKAVQGLDHVPWI